MNCEGDPTETCGGQALIDLYNFTGTYPIGSSVVPSSGEWASIGCYRYSLAFTLSNMCINHFESDSISSRTLERSVDAGSTTVQSCVNACQSQMFTIAGLEYADECCMSCFICDEIAMAD